MHPSYKLPPLATESVEPTLRKQCYDLHNVDALEEQESGSVHAYRG